MSIAIGPEYGAVITMRNNLTGAEAVFNNAASANYVGMLDPNECSGLDCAEVREAPTENAEEDGGNSGNVFMGRRSIVLGGYFDAGTGSTRNAKYDKLMRALFGTTEEALGSVQIKWTPAGSSTEVEIQRAHLQQPVRTPQMGGFFKKFQVSLVADDPCIYGASISEAFTAGAATTLTNPSTNYASTANLAGTVSGATLTASANEFLKVDSVEPIVGNTVLLKNQTLPAQNGIYTVTNKGSGTTKWVLTELAGAKTGYYTTKITAGSTLINTFWRRAANNEATSTYEQIVPMKATLTVTNQGTAFAKILQFIVVGKGWRTMVIRNKSTSKSFTIVYTGAQFGNLMEVQLFMNNKNVICTSPLAEELYSYVVFGSSTWWRVAPGANELEITADTTTLTGISGNLAGYSAWR